MGLGGFFKGLGKAALKVAPIAANFIPGVGPIAGAAIGAATSAIGKKASGGSWKDALKSGATGAATGAIGSKIPSGLGKGLAPSTGGLKGALGSIGKGALNSFVQGESGGMPTGIVSDQSNTGWQDLLKVGVDAFANRRKQPKTGQAQPTGRGPLNYPDDYAGTMEGVGPSSLMMRNQNFPNLAEALNAGRQAAYKRYPYNG